MRVRKIVARLTNKLNQTSVVEGASEEHVEKLLRIMESEEGREAVGDMFTHRALAPVIRTRHDVIHMFIDTYGLSNYMIHGLLVYKDQNLLNEDVKEIITNSHGR